MSRAVISILTAASDEMWNLMRLTAHNRVEYATTHDYQLFLRRHIDIVHFPEERMTNIVEALKETDYLLVMGVDTIFTNMTIKIEDLIKKYPDVDVIVSKDINGLNNDVMLVRNSQMSVMLFRTIVGRLDEFPEDQTAMATFFDSEERIKVAYPHQKEINAMPYWLYNYPDHKGGQWEIGDYIFHCPGLPWKTRRETIDDMLKNYIVRKEEDICLMKEKLAQAKQIAGNGSKIINP